MGSKAKYSGIRGTWRSIGRAVLMLALAMALSWGYHLQEVVAQLHAQTMLLKRLSGLQSQYVQEVSTANLTCVQALHLVRVGLAWEADTKGITSADTMVLVGHGGIGGN